MLLAEFEVRHTRKIAPTRRVALGETFLPADPAPGFGGVLLGAIVARYAQELDDDEDRDDLLQLIGDLDADLPVPQPRLRHRFQVDTVGLDRSHFELHGVAEVMTWQQYLRGTAAQVVLAAVYAAGQFPEDSRHYLFRLLRRAVQFVGISDENALRFAATDEYSRAHNFLAVDDPIWALRVLGFSEVDNPSRNDVLSRFRNMVRDAHPDSGGEIRSASVRVGELLRAKRILLANVF